MGDYLSISAQMCFTGSCVHLILFFFLFFFIANINLDHMVKFQSPLVKPGTDSYVNECKNHFCAV